MFGWDFWFKRVELGKADLRLNWKLAAVGGAVLFVIILLLALFLPQRAKSAGSRVDCRHQHRAGYYHAVCSWPNPTSFSVRAAAKQPYRVSWSLSCRSRVRNRHIGSAAVAFAGRFVGSGYMAVRPARAMKAVMLTAADCTLAVSFTRIRPAVSHLMTGLIVINGLPKEVIYDHTAPGQ